MRAATVATNGSPVFRTKLAYYEQSVLKCNKVKDCEGLVDGYMVITAATSDSKELTKCGWQYNVLINAQCLDHSTKIGCYWRYEQ